MKSPRQPAVPASHHRPEPPPIGGVLLTSVQAAEALGVTARVLERWRGCGDGPPYVRLTSKTIRYRSEDLEAFIQASLRASTAPGAELAAAG